MLSSPHSQLAIALNLSDVSNEEELSVAIVALLTSVRDDETRVPLSKIAHEIAQGGGASLLEPLDVLPILLPLRDPAAKEVLALMGECSSAKEVVMAIQEAIERMRAAYEGEDEDEVGRGDQWTLSYPSQLTILVELYSACLPRLKPRRKTASETLRPLLLELESAIRLAGARSSREEGRALISAVSHLIYNSKAWAESAAEGVADEMTACKDMLRSSLDCAVVACEHCVNSSLAQRTFESFFPRLTIRSAVTAGWEGGEEAISDAINAYTSLGVSSTAVLSTPSTATMIIFAHSAANTLRASQLPKVMAILVASIKAGSALDEALTLLLHALDPRQAASRTYLSDEVIHPLFAVLPPLASSHPDPLIRHQAFRLLSTLLSTCPPPIRLQLLSQLTVDPDFPQMRVAAVGLVKEAVLEALAHPPNLFASPRFFDVFGPIIFRPNPPDPQNLQLGEFKESSEAARMIESLGTYYTILQRDTANLTHMRNLDAVKHVETTLITPLRLAIERWANSPDGRPNDDNYVVGSLQMSLELIDSAIATIKDKSRG
ncbi:putative uncharacterised protein family, YAP/Alf4/glomulin [Lyophyllum shimeji]|uniref:Uncharacterized protein n=1 Tax=Lyophyllum shimeji TaxID=47721 RepID=A0A9P3UPN6_LYOSH|nr:putative uncharacterised protein family, YAP/Alf4/glomulin [Lyophyllum shimeji]